MSGVIGNIVFSLDVSNIHLEMLGVMESFILIEDTSSMFPTARLKFVDITGEAMNNLDLLYTEPLEYNIGFPKESELDNLEQYKHRLFDLKKCNLTSPMDTRSVNFDITSWSEIAPEFCVGDKVRSFGEKSASEAIKAILSSSSASAGIIETSTDSRNYIQAMWTDAQMIKHLADNAVSSVGGKGFLFFTDRDSKLTFASAKYLYNKGKSSAKTLTYSNLSDADDADSIIEYSFSSPAGLYMTSQGYGKRFNYYDSESYEYKEETKTVEDEVAKVNFSDYMVVDKNNMDLTRGYNVGQKIDDSDLEFSGRHLSSLVDLNVLVKHNPDIKLGSVVKVVLPVKNDDESNEANMISDTFSSYWLVCKITHYIKGISYMMKITLTRSGLGMKDAKNLLA